MGAVFGGKTRKTPVISLCEGLGESDVYSPEICETADNCFPISNLLREELSKSGKHDLLQELEFANQPVLKPKKKKDDFDKRQDLKRKLEASD
jgi:hypothetical protein